MRADKLSIILADAVLLERLERRFREKVAVAGADDCWEWTACRANGYGAIQVWPLGRFIASRVAWALETGASPGDLQVCHRCDNRGCCNPGHMFLGDNDANMADARQKGRMKPPPVMRGEASPRCKYPERYPRGERHHNAAINADIAREIRSSAETIGALSRRLGVSRCCVSSVRSGKTWTTS